MYNHELTLIGQIEKEDDLGNQIYEEKPTTVLCKLQSIGRNEFYSASTAGLRPEKIFVIHGYEYNQELLIEFNGDRYSVIRTYANDFEEMELVCERKVADV